MLQAAEQNDVRKPRGQPAALESYYKRLLAQMGPQGWWPARTQIEVILGAILVQNTAWANARQAIAQLRRARLLSLPKLRRLTRSQLETRIRSAGFFHQKAATIHSFLRWLGRTHDGSLDKLFRHPTLEIREMLLNLKGFGPETVDAILLYAGRQSVFVADAYTRRIMARHGLVSAGADYDTVQQFLHRHLPADHTVFNEFHALLVEVGKRYCRKQAARCEQCPLKEFLPTEPSGHRTLAFGTPASANRLAGGA